MRLFLLPISTRRTLIYSERVQEAVHGAKQSYSDRIINKASQTWADWEKAEKGWQKKLTVYGNKALSRIAFEEWGLKSIPPATKTKLEEIDQGKHKFECLYPGAFMKSSNVSEVLKKLATERQALHKRGLIQSLVCMPIVAPFALVPVVPNIPFFYLVFRAWSHYRALYGGRLLEHVMKKNLVQITDSKQMNAMYTAGLLHPTREESRKASEPTAEETEEVIKKVEDQSSTGKDEAMLLKGWNGKLIAEAFHLPEMEVEIERAVEQVEKSIKANKQALVKEKKELEEVASQKTGQADEAKR
ncbi:hypothetical protein LTR08_000058 [Meristemomyces frigidus]|nr:hypothetical protein LTR08_000058 [Meristemomyces frigidus]